MNILEVEDIIKGLPDQALMQEAQAPSGQVPQFLVVSEIQRRADMRKRYQSQQEQPQGTVAEQIVQGGIMGLGGQQQPIGGAPQQPQMPPQGMQPPMGQPPMPPQGMQPPMSPPMSPPMMPPQGMAPQGMAAGGVVRMQEGSQLPYTGGTQIDPGYDEFMRQQRQDYLLNQGRIKESMPRPELNMLDRFLIEAQKSGPNYSSIAPSGLGFEDGIIPSGLGERIYSSIPESSEILDALKRGLDPFNQRGDIDQSLAQGQQSPVDLTLTNTMTDDFMSKYLGMPSATKDDAFRFYEVTKNQPPKVIAESIESGASTTDPEQKHQQDQQKGDSQDQQQDDLQGGSKVLDFSGAMGVLDQLQGVDYSQFKPDYSTIISEQERRAQKIRDDASKDASAQALIQLGAGLAAGDIAGGLSKAGQTVADIKRQARGEAREEEALARQMRLAQDEAAMQLGLKGAEAEREMAKFKATYGVSLMELKQTMDLAKKRIESEGNTEAGRALRARITGLNDLITRLQADPYDSDGKKEAISNALQELKSLLGVSSSATSNSATSKKQDLEDGFSFLGIRMGQ